MSRPHNFNAGPAILPLEVLEEAREALLNTAGSGLSILEWSHRSLDYAAVHRETEACLRRLVGLSSEDSHRVLFLQGGASLQFAQVPWNLAHKGCPGAYLVTGVWSEKALLEARRLGLGRSLWSGEPEEFCRLPEPHEWQLGEGLAYLHMTTNNTIYGTEWKRLPECPGVPLVADMSSDILSGPLDVERLGLIYAGAQKNLGPAGLALVIIREDLLERSSASLPAILSYKVHAHAGSLYHTPPTFAVWLMGRVLAWIERQGGLLAMGRRNARKADRLYWALDASSFFETRVRKEDRSRMNVTFRLKDPALESLFLDEAQREGFVGLKGHRAVGGVRASLYNALPLESVEALVAFIQEFERTHG